MFTRYDTRTDNGGTPVTIDLAERLTVAEAVEIAKREVKQIALGKILAIAPEWKQRNMVARGVELERTDRRGGLTQEQQAEVDQIQQIWDSVKAIRQASDQIEAEIDAAASNQGTPVAVMDVPRADNPAWP